MNESPLGHPERSVAASRDPVGRPQGFAAGFLDFARNDWFGYFTLIFFRRYVGTSRSSPSTIVGSLFSNRPRLTGSNCKTSCLACMDFSVDTFSSFGGGGFLRGALTGGGSGGSTTSNEFETDSTGGAGAVSTSGKLGSSTGVSSAD